MSWGTSFAWPEEASPIDTSEEYLQQVAKERNNQVPTHDPYANPNAQLYYSCGCGAIFDPGTKRFAELNNAASNAGWKVRFIDSGYVPYCVDCGKGVE